MAGQCDHRAAAEPGVLQAGSEVGGAYRLRHAHPRPAADPGIAVGHIGRRFLRMSQDRLHPEIAQMEERAAQHRLDEKDMAHAGPRQCPRQPFRAVHRTLFAHAEFLRSGPPRIRSMIKAP